MSFNNLCLDLIDCLLFKSSIKLYIKGLLKKDKDFNFCTLNILNENEFGINEFNPNDMTHVLYGLILKNFYSKRFNDFERTTSSNNKTRYDKFITNLDSLLVNSSLVKNVVIFNYIYDYITNPEFSSKVYQHEVRYEIEDLITDEKILKDFMDAKINVQKMINQIHDLEYIIDKDLEYITEYDFLKQKNDKITGGIVYELNEATEVILENF